MLSIALVDDDAKDLARSQGLLTEYFAQRPQLEGELHAFSSSGALLEAASRNGFDVYLLDVMMPGENGIQLGRELREEGKYGAIIYLTYSPDFAVESYAARAFYYLLKPVKQEELFRVLDEAVNHLAVQQEESILLRVRDGLRSLTVGQILYAELSQRRLCCHLASGEVVRSVSLRESFREAAAELLRNPCFEMCGVSFAVNLNHVTGVSKKAVELAGGLAVPLSRAYREAFIRRWIDYSLERGR